MTSTLDYRSMLAVALAEARLGLKEGGIPIGAAIFDQTGKLIGAGHNRRVQQGDPSVHARDGCVPKGRPSKKLPQAHHGDDARALLVLQWFGAPVWIWHRGGWREQELSGWDRLVAFLGSAGDRSRLAGVRFAACKLYSRESCRVE